MKKHYQKPTVLCIMDLPDVATLLRSSADTLCDWDDGVLESEVNGTVNGGF